MDKLNTVAELTEDKVITLVRRGEMPLGTQTDLKVAALKILHVQ